MPAIFRNLKGYLLSNLGHCMRCMRQSFVFMLGMWGLALVMMSMTAWPLAVLPVQVVALGATALWLSHMTVFALRAVRSPHPSKSKAIVRNPGSDLSVSPRREFLLGFAKSFLLVTAATALPAAAAFAQDRMQNCLTCCATRLNACGNGGNCNTLYQNCVSSCNSQGETPSDWNCW